MSSGDQQTVARESLAVRLAQAGALGAEDAVRIVAQIAGQVVQLHASGCFHGEISLEAVFLDEVGGASLTPRGPGLLVIDRPAQRNLFPPQFERNEVIQLPESIAAAREILRSAGIQSEPAEIDVYQLGALLCRLLTNEPVDAYLRSPRVKGRVPADCQAVLERALGFDARDRFSSVAEMSGCLASLRSDAETPSPASTGEADAAAIPAAAADTAPSIVSLAPEPDTSIDSHPAAVPPADEDHAPFDKLGHYEIVRRIGQGGMGDVYLGYEKALDRQVAIKVLPADFGRHDDFVRRFYAEATAAARLSHPNVIDIYFIGEDQGHHFFAMQYVDGETLAAMLARHRRLSVDQTLSIVTGALQGLAAAHQQGLVHRDIKPGNILLDRQNRRVLVADFGLVKSLQAGSGLTATGTVMGTVDYLSPEQGRGQPVDARSDLYSFGVLLYRMLSGELPFHADSPTAMIFQHVYETPAPLTSVAADVPAVLSAIVDKLLAKSPADRYDSAADLLTDLRAFRESRPLPSGADVIVPTDDDAGIVLLEEASQSIILAPSFQDEPDLPENLDEAAPTGIWGRLRNQVIDAVEERAPEFVHFLQNTQQQVDHAVAEYERRQRTLQRLADDAEAVLVEFEQQAQEWRSAAAGSGEQPRQLAEILEQIAAQREQFETIQLRLAQANARLLQLGSQRDLLNARLKAAQARVRMSGGKVVERRRLLSISWLPRLHWTRTTQAVCTVIALCAIGAISYGIFQLYSPADRGTQAAHPKPADGAVERQVVLPADVTVHRFPLRQFSEFENVVVSASMSSDGSLIAAGDINGVIKVCDVRTGDPVKSVTEQGTSPADGVTFSRDSRLVASNTAVWDVASGKMQADFRANGVRDQNRLFLGLNPDNSRATALEARETHGVPPFEVTIVQYAIEMPSSPDQWVLPQQYGSAKPVAALSHDGETLAVLDVDRHLHLWNLARREEISRFEALKSTLQLTSLCFSDDGKLLAGIEDGKNRAVILDAKTGRIVDVAPALRGKFSGVLAFDHSGQKLALATIVTGEDQKKIQFVDVWDLRFNRFRLAIGPFGSVRALTFSPDDGRILVGGSDPNLSLWSTEMGPIRSATAEWSSMSRFGICYGRDILIFGKEHHVGTAPLADLSAVRDFPDFPDVVAVIDVSPDGKTAVVGGNQGTVCAYDVATGAILRTINVAATARSRGALDSGSSKNVRGVSFGNDNRLVLIGSTYGMFLWDLQTGAEINRFEDASGAGFVAVMSPDGRYAVTDTWNQDERRGEPLLYEVDTGKLVRRFYGHVHYVKSATFSPDGKRLLTGGKGFVHIWDVETGKELLRLSSKRSMVWFDAIAISRDGRLAAGYSSGTITAWDTKSGETVGEYNPAPAESLFFTDDGRELLSASSTSGLKVWPVTSVH